MISAVAGHHFAVAGAVELARFRGAGQRFDGLAQHVTRCSPLRSPQSLLQRRDQFFQMLGAGVLALQESFDVAGDQLPLHGAGLAVAEFFGGRNSVAARMLGDIHSRVGDANDFFRRKSMHGKLATPKLPVMWCSLSMGSVREPQPQALGQDLRLLDAGFRHQDDEFVAAVAGDHVRLPAFLFQQSSDARQHQVAFQVAHGVVHFLELVEIDQHHREWPAGARSAFPLGTRAPPRRSAAS